MNDVATGLRLGRYVLGDRLAQGGMGEVYLAVQEGLGQFQKPLALKLLLPHLMERPEAVQMFLDEARLAARMNHPNVVQIFDVGEEQGRYFIAMELVRGVSLSTLIKVLRVEKKQPSAEILSYVGRALLDALDHAHEQTGADGEWLGLVHRDVTPHNLLVSVHGELKLTDFGIARATGKERAPQEQALLGKTGYFAPEQITKGTADRRTDLFSAALTLYELATLEPAYRRDSDAASLFALQFEPPPDLAMLRPDLPAAFANALERAASKDPTQRFATAKAFKEAWPNLATPDTATLLGSWVSQLCRGAISQLDGKTQRVVTGVSTGTQDPLPKAGTDSLPAAEVVLPATAEVRGRSDLAPAKKDHTARNALFAGLGVLAAAAVLGVLWRHFVVPAPVVVTELPAPTRDVTPPPPSEPTPVPHEVPAPVVAESHPAESEPARPHPTEAHRPAAPKPASNKVGYLSVDSTPWSEVRVNGTLIGETPIAKFPLAEGRVQVVLTNPSTGKQASKWVNVQAGQSSSFRLTLK